MGSGALARTYHMKPANRKSSAFDRKGDRVKTIMISCVKSFVRKILHKNSDRVEVKVVWQQTATMYLLNTFILERSGHSTKVWRTDEDAPAVQSFPFHVAQLRFQYWHILWRKCGAHILRTLVRELTL